MLPNEPKVGGSKPMYNHFFLNKIIASAYKD